MLGNKETLLWKAAANLSVHLELKITKITLKVKDKEPRMNILWNLQLFCHCPVWGRKDLLHFSKELKRQMKV